MPHCDKGEEDRLWRALIEAERVHERAVEALPEARRVAQAEVRANEAAAELDDACRAYNAALEGLPERAAEDAARRALAEFRATAQQVMLV